MPTEYLSDLDMDEHLSEVVAPVLPRLQTLTAAQVETLIFYLHSLHGYYPASFGHTDNHERFSSHMKAIRESERQLALQRKASRYLLAAMTLAGVSTMLLTLGAYLWMVRAGAWAPAALIASSVGVFMFAEARFGVAALATAKHQDRRYFLECIGAARGCNELGWAGLFTTEDICGPERTILAQQAKRATRLRSALLNDEGRQFRITQSN